MRFEARARYGWAVLAAAGSFTADAGAQTPCRGGSICEGAVQRTLTFADLERPQVPPWVVDLTLPAFDATLGELVRVEVRATAPSEAFFGAENLHPSQTCPGGQWTLGALLHAGFANEGPVLFDTATVIRSSTFGPLAPFDGTIDFGGASGHTTLSSGSIDAEACFDDAGVLEAFRSDGPGAELTLTAATTPVFFEQNSSRSALALAYKLQVGIGIEIAYTYCVPTGVPYCFGDGSGTPCPCDNAGDPGHGCANGSFAGGAALAGAGDPSVGSDSLVLSVSASTPGKAGLFFQGALRIAGGNGEAFGDGLRCAGWGVVRLQAVGSDATGAASTTIPIAATGGAAPGDVRSYQWWYRDPTGSPCGSGFNLSNGFEVTWAP